MLRSRQCQQNYYHPYYHHVYHNSICFNCKLLPTYVNNEPRREPRNSSMFLFWTWIPDHSQNIVCASVSCWKPLANYDLLAIWCTKIALAAKMQYCIWNGSMMLMKWINPGASGHPILSNIGSQYSVAVLNQIESHSCGVMTLGIE